MVVQRGRARRWAIIEHMNSKPNGGLEKVVKRNGFTVDHDQGRIRRAIAGAAHDVNQMTSEEIDQVAADVERVFADAGKNVATVEEIQDVVEKRLMAHGFHDVARSYIRYRQRHEQRRYAQKQLLRTYHDLFFADAADMDDKRDNANVNVDAPMGIMLKLGEAGAKFYSDQYPLIPEATDAHNEHVIHIHDLAWERNNQNCLQIDLLDLFNRGGFSTGHGHLRAPQSIRAAASLACIAIQANQNDMFGGQSINCWDYAMAYGIRKSFTKAIIANTRRAAELMDATYTGGEVAMIDDLKTVKCTYTEPGDVNRDSMIAELRLALARHVPTIMGDAEKIYRAACVDVEDETKQAMEAAIHNYNSLNCLPASEEIWILDTTTNVVGLMRMEKIAAQFSPGRFKVISVNRTTGKPEWKAITEVSEAGDHRRLIKLTDAAGRKVVTTDNHRIMFLANDGTIRETVPEILPHTLAPRNFSKIEGFDVSDKIYLEEYDGPRGVYENTPFKEPFVIVDEQFAKLAGFFVAEGSTTETTSDISFGVCNKEKEVELIELVKHVFGDGIKHTCTMYGNDRKPSTICFCVGRRVVRMFRDKFGIGAHNKRIPNEILFGSNELRRAFLNGYLRCDGSIKDRFVDASTVSKSLQKQLLLMFFSLGELGNLNEGPSVTSYGSTYRYEVGVIANATVRMQLELGYEQFRAEVHKYNFDFLYDAMFKNFKGRKPKRIRFSHQTIDELAKERQWMEACTYLFAVPIETTEELNSGDEKVYDIAVEDNETFMTADCIFVHNSRAGAQVPFSSINYGMDTSPEGRLAIRWTLEAIDAGLGHGETAIFPISVFQLKAGVNYNEGDPNYDLFKLACKVSARRLFPNFTSIDASFNLPYYREGDYNSYVATMGCRTRVMSNVNGPEISGRRGNFAFTTINLPRLALMAKGDVDEFFKLFDHYITLCHDYLQARFEVIAEKHVYNFPFLFGQHLHIGSDKLKPDDTIREAIKNASLSIGFCGLAECLVVLLGTHHGESEDAQALGLRIVRHLRARTDAYTKAEKMNWSTFATPAESTAGTFQRANRKVFGVILGVTEHEYLTNSFHVPVYFPITAARKVDIEAPYHALCNAGAISYIELDGDTSANVDAFERVVRYMHDKDMGYFSINHAVDRDPICGYTGIIKDECPYCHRREIPNERFTIKRITL